jgi:hypothetical protein
VAAVAAIAELKTNAKEDGQEATETKVKKPEGFFRVKLTKNLTCDKKSGQCKEYLSLLKSVKTHTKSISFQHIAHVTII